MGMEFVDEEVFELFMVLLLLLGDLVLVIVVVLRVCLFLVLLGMGLVVMCYWVFCFVYVGRFNLLILISFLVLLGIKCCGGRVLRL